MLEMLLEVFEQNYLTTIAKIALKAVQNRDVDIIKEFDPIILDFRAKKEEDYGEGDRRIRLLKEQAIESGLDGFNFDFGNDLFANEVYDTGGC